MPATLSQRDPKKEVIAIVDYQQLSTLDKLKIIFRVIRAKAAADEVVENPSAAPAHVQSLIQDMERRWQQTRDAALAASSDEVTAILDEYEAPFDEGLVLGQKDIEQRYLAGEDVDERFLLWGLLYVYRERSQQLARELGLRPEAKEATLADGKRPAPLDEEALRTFQEAVELPI